MEGHELYTMDSLENATREYFDGFATNIEFRRQDQLLSIRVWRINNFADYIFNLDEINSILYNKVYHRFENIKGALVIAEKSLVLRPKRR